MMSEQKVNVTYPLLLTTVTPVAIHDGRSLSPLSDYTIKNGKLYFINKKTFEHFLLKNNVLEDYIEAIEDNTNREKSNFLFDFIEQHKEESEDIITTYFHSNVNPVKGLINAVELKTIQKNNGKLYIAGSSIKGGIKTALFYNWLRYEDEGNKLLKKTVQHFQSKPLNLNKDKIFEINDLSQLRNLVGNSKNIKKVNIGELLNEDKLFGKIQTRYRMAYSFFKVSDTNTIDLNYLDIFNIHMFLTQTPNKERGEDKGLDTLKEAIKAGTNFQFQIQLTDSKLDNHHYLNEKFKDLAQFKNDITTLFQKLNTFAYDNILYEIEVFDKDIQGTYKQRLEEYGKELVSLKKIIEKEKQNPNSSIAFIRIGSGKTYFYNAIGLALFNNSNVNLETLNAFREEFKLNSLQKFYPVTRKLSSVGQLPFGWVKIVEK